MAELLISESAALLLTAIQESILLRKSLRSSTLGLLALVAEARDTREDWDSLFRGELNLRGSEVGESPESGNRPESLLLIPLIRLLLPELPWPQPRLEFRLSASFSEHNTWRPLLLVTQLAVSGHGLTAAEVQSGPCHTLPW